MPTYSNALAERPANMLAYQDTLSATPRNEYLGALADFLAQSYSPERTQQMQGISRFLSAPEISQTLDRLSYGEPLTTGAGMTTRIRPEALEAAMAVAPAVKPATMASLQAARLARQAALATKGMPVGMSTEAVGGMGFLKNMANKDVNVGLNESSKFLSAKSPFGEVGGTIRQPDRFSDKPYLQINYAEVEQASRGSGKGKELYKALIDEAQKRGLRVFSDSTVEKSAVNVYKSLERNGYKLQDMSKGSLDDGAVYGAGAQSPAFEISPLSKFQAPQENALRLAQQRAALPPSQGGLGLPANNTAQQRAAIMFPDEVFHGSKTPENIRKLVAGGESGSIRTGDAYGTGVYTTTDAAGDASAYGAGGAVFPLRINRSGHLQIDAPNADDLQKLSKFAGESMLPSDKARFAVGREKREFADVQDARDFFANQRENWNQFGGGYDRARPEALANPNGTFAVEFTNFDAPVPITSGKDADTLLRATGYDNVQSLGYTGHTLDRGNGRLWDVTADTDQLRSRFAAFDPFRRTAAIAATMGVAAPDLLAAEQAQQDAYTQNEMRKFMRQGRQKK